MSTLRCPHTIDTEDELRNLRDDLFATSLAARVGGGVFAVLTESQREAAEASIAQANNLIGEVREMLASHRV